MIAHEYWGYTKHNDFGVLQLQSSVWRIEMWSWYYESRGFQTIFAGQPNKIIGIFTTQTCHSFQGTTQTCYSLQLCQSFQNRFIEPLVSTTIWKRKSYINVFLDVVWMIKVNPTLILFNTSLVWTPIVPISACFYLELCSAITSIFILSNMWFR